MGFEKITEADSSYRHIESMTTMEVLQHINDEDRKVAEVISHSLDAVANLIDAISDKLLLGGRLFYIGAGTSGRLGILDASECPPTFGVPPGLVIGIIAGGEQALRNAVEFAEDDLEQGWADLQEYIITEKDFVVGLSASGATPYVMQALQKCREYNIVTGSICCNPGSPISAIVDFPVEVPLGPEFITGSTRMKAGTAQKMLLNMISTAVMIQLGRVEDNKMVHMQLSNEKLIDRGVKMVMKNLDISDYAAARELLLKHGSVKKAGIHNRT